MTDAELEKILAELYAEIDDVYSLKAELDLLDYVDTVEFDSLG